MNRIHTGLSNLELIGATPHYAEPCSIFRFLLHYHVGLLWLGQSALVRSALVWGNRLVARMVAPDKWAYMIFAAVRKEG